MSACDSVAGLDRYDTCADCVSSGETTDAATAEVRDAAGTEASSAMEGGVIDGSKGTVDGEAAADAARDGGDSGSTDGASPRSDAAGDAQGSDASDGGSGSDLASGLVALYLFDETSGTSAADSSGNNHTATLVGGATFAAGLENNAVTLSGSGQYVSLPAGIVDGLSSFSITA
jgi:hypothetical protein